MSTQAAYLEDVVLVERCLGRVTGAQEAAARDLFRRYRGRVHAALYRILGGNADMRIAEELAEVEPGPERDSREKAIREDVARLKEKALAGGGLYVLATERHESRRIDNQLRGRSGRRSASAC